MHFDRPKFHSIHRPRLSLVIPLLSLLLLVAVHLRAGPPIAPTSAKFCDGAVCVFDVGLNTGQDTRFYLNDETHPNVRVVSIDANPQLITSASRQFGDALSRRRLALVTAGLAGVEDDRGDLVFWTNRNEKFSSFNESLGCRDGFSRAQPAGDHTYCTGTAIPTRTCASLVEEFGKPAYVKVDIEGFDAMCIRSLVSLSKELLPKYLSVENVHRDVVERLWETGYRWFKAVDQLQLQMNVSEVERGHSGPWGDDAEDALEGRRWISKDALLQRSLERHRVVDGVTRSVWYDLHAMRQ